MGRNQLTELDFTQLKNLQVLSLFSNKLKKIDGLNGLKKLWFLDVNNNPLEKYELFCVVIHFLNSINYFFKNPLVLIYQKINH